jgi:DHA2 family multidrug resistance protein
VSSLEAKDMPQGTALNNMMRQLGGSFGISIINTYVARRIASHRIDLITHITADNPISVSRINTYTGVFQQKGFSLLDAQQKAIELIEKVVIKQSSFSSYLDGFLLIGLFFAIALPLLLFVAKRDKKRPIVIPSSDH